MLQVLFSHCSYVVIRQPDGKWGVPTEGVPITAYWQGMIGSVMKREVDFAAASFSITSQRQIVVDFAAPFYREMSIVALKMPQPDSRIWLYVKMFSPIVWALLFVCTLGIIIGFWLMNVFTFEYVEFPEDDPSIMELKRLGYSVIYFFFTLIAEGKCHL